MQQPSAKNCATVQRDRYAMLRRKHLQDVEVECDFMIQLDIETIRNLYIIWAIVKQHIFLWHSSQNGNPNIMGGISIPTLRNYVMDDQPQYGQITQILTSAICIIDYHCIIGFFLQRPTS